MAREILGHIDCPTCGTKAGMRITHDKNGEPFGYCEAGCNQQMRIGGDKRRVSAFVARYPWAAGKTEPLKVTVTVPNTKAQPTITAEIIDQKKPAPAKARSAFEDAVSFLTGGK